MKGIKMDTYEVNAAKVAEAIIRRLTAGSGG